MAAVFPSKSSLSYVFIIVRPPNTKLKRAVLTDLFKFDAAQLLNKTLSNDYGRWRVQLRKFLEVATVRMGPLAVELLH